MALAFFLKADGIEGESRDSDHKNWTDALGYSMQIRHVGSPTGGGKSTGTSEFHDLVVMAKQDKALPTFMLHAANGKHIPKIELHAVKTSGDSKINFIELTLQDAMVTGCRPSSHKSDSDEPMVEYSFNADKVKWKYTEQTEKGAKGAQPEHGWDFKEGKKL